MYNLLNTSKLLSFVFAIAILFSNCDGQDRKHKSNTEVLQENNQLSAYSKKVEFIPNKPVVIYTDTILSNGFTVKINYHSIEKESFYGVVENENDTTNIKNYKNFEAKISVYKDNSPIAETTISKMTFLEFEDASFWKSAIMQYVWVDPNASNENVLCLNTSFKIVDTENFKDFVVMIDKHGVIKINERKMNC
ncbi:hypothetical protein [Algibacter sp. R77976]|uniref:hypothetical protein n=1 Tax=Algibacter sp. R77976 TaxID=3093873 RepID=UPI0037C5FEC6